jgi:acetyltransferase-like isoleucine patch superfamily enzyme
MDEAAVPVVLEHDWFPRALPANIVLGERSWLYGAYAFLHYRSKRPCGLRVGKDSGIYVETFFDLGPEGEVEIGDYCTLSGPTLCTNGRIVIGDYVLISREVVLADTFAAAPPQQEEAAKAALLTRHPQPSVSAATDPVIVVGDDAWIGSRAVLLSGARLGKGVIVGAGAVVDFPVPDYAIVAGNPAHVVGWARPEERST